MQNFVGLWSFDKTGWYRSRSLIKFSRVSLLYLSGSRFILFFSIANDLDAVICSHATVNNAAGLAYLYGRLGATCPLYTTVATELMLQILFSDTFENIQNENTFNQFAETLPITGINSAIRNIIGVRFSQPIYLTGKADGLALTAYPAGYTLGGSYWKIRKGSEDIFYASQFNHKKERYGYSSFIFYFQIF